MKKSAWKRMSLACLSVSLFFSASAYAANVSYDTKYNGHCYKLFNDGTTWEQAKAACERQGGYLVSITSSQEQAVVENLLRSKGNKNNYWLGAYRNGSSWIWVTGERFSYTHWSGGQPDNFQGRENRLSMYRNRNPYGYNNLGEWNDSAPDGVCNNEPFFGAVNFGYICEWDSDPNTNSNNSVDGRLKGDVNGDGKVDQTDAEILKLYIMNPSSGIPCPKNADANSDGKIDIADVTKIVGTYSQTPTPKPITTINPLPSYREWQGTAAKRVTAYTNSALTSRNGTEYVDAGDKVTVLKEEGNAYFVRYPVRNGTKERWVTKDIFTPVPTPQGLLYPLKGRAIENSSTLMTNGQRCDYRAPFGTPIYAPADGMVQFRQSYAIAERKLASYGNNIVFTSRDGQYYVLCAHLSKFNGVELKYTTSCPFPCGSGTGKGKYRCNTITLATKNVTKGELIGWSGETGNAKGAHVHIEVKKNGRAVNPKNVFTVWN